MEIDVLQRLRATDWRPVIEDKGALFLISVDIPGVWRRERGTEIRYSWDGDGKVVADLADIAAAINREPARYTAGDAPEARDD